MAEGIFEGIGKDGPPSGRSPVRRSTLGRTRVAVSQLPPASLAGHPGQGTSCTVVCRARSAWPHTPTPPGPSYLSPPAPPLGTLARFPGHWPSLHHSTRPCQHCPRHSSLFPPSFLPAPAAFPEWASATGPWHILSPSGRQLWCLGLCSVLLGFPVRSWASWQPSLDCMSQPTAQLFNPKWDEKPSPRLAQ